MDDGYDENEDNDSEDKVMKKMKWKRRVKKQNLTEKRMTSEKKYTKRDKKLYEILDEL